MSPEERAKAVHDEFFIPGSGDFAHDGFSPLKSPSPPKDQGHE